MYAEASMVVVPVINTPFPFGITTVLEGMSMEGCRGFGY